MLMSNRSTVAKTFIFLFAATLFLGCAQKTLHTPAESRNFTWPSTHDEIHDFCNAAARHSQILEKEVFGQSVEGRELVVVKAAKKSNVTETEKLRVLLFAQQHGNEQAGKEGALLLIRDLAEGKFDHWFDHMEVWIVPQVNPDGGEVNQRRNALNRDLNRDHRSMEAPETYALHALFREWLPHVTIDVHEYQPYRDSWAEFGGYKQFDMQVGVNTNINIDERIRMFSLQEVLPFLEEYLATHGYSFQNYIVGPPPSDGITRHSTTDIDDGRHGFGIRNTLSFIFEGINGRDGFIEKLERRSLCQLETKRGLLEFLYINKDTVVHMVNIARNDLINSQTGEMVAIQTQFVSDGESLIMPLKSSVTGADTMVVVENYKPLVKPKLQVERPRGYLIPRNDELLMEWVEKHGLKSLTNIPAGTDVYGWNLRPIRFDPPGEPLKTAVDISDRHERYLFIPIQQLHTNFLVLALEPLSDIGLIDDALFGYLLDETDWYPIYRVE